MAKFVLTDSCFWLGLVDPTDQHHVKAREWADIVDQEGAVLLIPWPCLYESVSTRLVRSRSRTLELEQLLKRPTIRLLDDSGYRDNALEEVFNAVRVGYSYALADSVIREMLKDINLRIDYLLTFNAGDFQDVCQARRIDLAG